MEATHLPAERPKPEPEPQPEARNPWMAQGFTVTEEHAALLAQMIVCFVEKPLPGAPAIDPAQPYGGADVYADMRRILDRPDASDEDMLALQEETATALQVLLNTQRLAAGQYVTPHGCCEWRPA